MGRRQSGRRRAAMRQRQGCCEKAGLRLSKDARPEHSAGHPSGRSLRVLIPLSPVMTPARSRMTDAAAAAKMTKKWGPPTSGANALRASAPPRRSREENEEEEFRHGTAFAPAPCGQIQFRRCRDLVGLGQQVAFLRRESGERKGGRRFMAIVRESRLRNEAATQARSQPASPTLRQKETILTTASLRPCTARGKGHRRSYAPWRFAEAVRAHHLSPFALA